MKKGNIYLLALIIILFFFTLWIILPLDEGKLGRPALTLGLDLSGGSYLVYKADLDKRDPSQSEDDAMEGVLEKIKRRVNAFGIEDPIIQRQGRDLILVQLPGIEDAEAAVAAIGQVARLDFRELQYDEDGNAITDAQGNVIWVEALGVGLDGEQKQLTGTFLKPNAQPVFGELNQPEVAFEWNEEGAVLFEQITERNFEKPLGIFLDDVMISSPVVQAVIKESGVITGVSIEEARQLAILLNSGSLDVPLEVIQEQDVDATLGADSVRKSLIAAAIGMALLVLFMLMYYRVSGFVAICALIVYSVVLIGIFKLGGITLTLPGVAALIVSLGMAVDANVLIFERMKEELRAGRTIGAAVEAGFSRAWPAIRDSNITTIIACAVLFWFGNTLGAFMVKGFAQVLGIGIILSMLSAIIVTRLFLRFIIRVVSKPGAFGVVRK